MKSSLNDCVAFRLISDKTVEENILKKAQNKRILGNIAIEGGNFTAAYFKQGSLKELFETNEDCDQPPTTITKQVAPAKAVEAPEVSTETDRKEPLKSMEYEEVSRFCFYPRICLLRAEDVLLITTCWYYVLGEGVVFSSIKKSFLSWKK